jgi:hypothetical protein
MTEPKRVEAGEYLSKYPPEMQAMAQEIRELILELEPEVDEVIKWKNLFYEKNGAVCAILIHKSHINLEFVRGRELTDLGYPLEGAGKNIRHVKIQNLEDINPSLRDLVVKAFEMDSKD